MKQTKEEKIIPDQTPETQEQQESKGKRIVNTVINVILVIAIVLAAFCTYFAFVSDSGSGTPSIFGISFFSVKTDSMYPNMEAGDLVIGKAVGPEKKTTPADLRVDDVITYWTVIDGNKVLNTHRIVGIYDGGDFLVFETKGDANTAVDALTVHENSIVAKWTGTRLPGVGKVFDYLQTATGFLLVVVVPVFLFFLFHLIQFFRTLFEYQNVKNRIKFEQERGRTEDLIAEQQNAQEETRARIEAELREKLKAEILASMASQAPTEKTEENAVEETN